MCLCPVTVGVRVALQAQPSCPGCLCVVSTHCPVPLYLIHQPCGEEQNKNLDDEQHDSHGPDESVVLLDPPGHGPQAAPQEDDTLGCELAQLQGFRTALRVPHGAILQRVQAAGGRDPTRLYARG